MTVPPRSGDQLDRLSGRWTSWIVFGVAASLWMILGLRLTRGTTFYSDEYTYFIANRGYSLRAIFAPHNGHLIAAVRFIYATVLTLFGPNYFIFRCLETFGIALVAGLFFAWARRRIPASAALGPSVLLLFLGAAAPEVTLSPLGITHVYCIAAGLGALLALESGSGRSDVLACGLLTLSVATFSTGLCFLVGVAVLVLLHGDRRRRGWIFLVPGVLYLVWLATPKLTGAVYANRTGFHPSNILLIPNFAADAAAALAAALTGLGTDFTNVSLTADAPTSTWGYVIAGLAVIAFAARVRRGKMSSSLWCSVSILLAFWVSIALVIGPNRYPYSQRYVYAGAVAGLLVFADALSGIRVSKLAVGSILAASAFALGANIARLRAAGDALRLNASSLRAALTAIEVAGSDAGPDFFGAPGSLPLVSDQRLFLAAAAVLTGGGSQSYLDAVRRNGSLGFPRAELMMQSEGVRDQVDESLVQLLGLRLVPAPRQLIGKCSVTGNGPGASHDLIVQPPGVVLRARVAETLTIRRFGTTATSAVGSLAASTFTALQIPRDRDPSPWHAVLPPGRVTICQLRPAP